MTLIPGTGGGTVADELERLSGRVDHAKRAAEARERTIVAETRQAHATSPAPLIDRRTLSWRRSRTGLIVALVLALLGAAATVIATRDDGGGTQVANPTAAPNGSAVANPSSAAGADGVPPGPEVPAASGPTTGETSPPTTPASLSAPGTGVSPDAATVVVVAGDSFWSIAEHQVVSVRGGAPTTAEVATYWSQLVEVNRSQLVNGSDPNLIYAGQTFSLP